MAAVCATAVVPVIGCAAGPPAGAGAGSGSDAGGPGAVGPADIGAVGLVLSLPGGEAISSISYTLTNGDDTYGGSYAVADAGTFSFVIGGVAVGTGYSLTLTATSDNGKDICAFPAPGAPPAAPFQVSSRATTVVDAAMSCVNGAGLDAGSLLVDTVRSDCPIWNLILVDPPTVGDGGVIGTSNAFNPAQSIPAQVPDGDQALVVGSGAGPDPDTLTFTWTILNPDGNGEHLADVAADASASGATALAGTSGTNQVSFTCPSAASPQTYTVQMVVGDGPVPDGGACDPRLATGTVQIVCEP
jgi:hypothetical protein